MINTREHSTLSLSRISAGCLYFILIDDSLLYFEYSLKNTLKYANATRHSDLCLIFIGDVSLHYLVQIVSFLLLFKGEDRLKKKFQKKSTVTVGTVKAMELSAQDVATLAVEVQK